MVTREKMTIYSGQIQYMFKVPGTVMMRVYGSWSTNQYNLIVKDTKYYLGKADYI